MQDEVPTHVMLAEKKKQYDADNKDKNEKLSNATYVILKGVNIPFWDLVQLLVKVVLASIPAAIIIGIITSVVMSVFGGVIAGLTRM